MTILGAVLAGGRATRFGRDKALALLGEATLLDHALASLASHVDALVVIGRGHAPVPTAPDLPSPALGPLGGIAGALLNDVGPEIAEAGLARIRGYVGRNSWYPTWLHAARALADSNADVYPDYALEDWLAALIHRHVVGG